MSEGACVFIMVGLSVISGLREEKKWWHQFLDISRKNCVCEGGAEREGEKARERQSVLPLSMSVSLQRAAIKTGLRSDMGLAVMMLPPTAWGKKQTKTKQLSLNRHTTTGLMTHNNKNSPTV